MLTKNDLHQIRNIVQEEISSEVAPLKKDISVIKKDIRKIKIDVKAHASYFDKEFIELKDRVKTVEGQLSINPLF